VPSDLRKPKSSVAEPPESKASVTVKAAELIAATAGIKVAGTVSKKSSATVCAFRYDLSISITICHL
jgi:hypothetical protein